MSCNHITCCDHCESCNPPEPPRNPGDLSRIFGPPIWEQAANRGEE